MEPDQTIKTAKATEAAEAAKATEAAEAAETAETTQFSEPIRWRAVEDSRLLWRSWPEEESHSAGPLYVAYSLDSDDTHLMNELGAEIIHCLQEKALSIEELLDTLAEEYLPSPSLRSMIPRPLIEQFIRQMTLAGVIFEEKPDLETMKGASHASEL